MDGQHLIYFSDPMCSWCWGFSPVVEAIEARYGDALPVRLIMGGLRPGTATPMKPGRGGEMRHHWRQVTEASGQPFGESVVDRSGFVYDTDPPARAVVLARRDEPSLGLAFLRAAHRAFYVDGRDVTDLDVLADMAGELGLDRAVFRAALENEGLKEETWGDYALSQNAGVRGFPTLIVGPNPDRTYAMITRGFRPAEEVLPAIDQWMIDHVQDVVA
jgi:putative protein-disulfide isomerase